MEKDNLDKYEVKEIREMFAKAHSSFLIAHEQTKEKEKWVLNYCENSSFFHWIDELVKSKKDFLNKKLEDDNLYNYNLKNVGKMIKDISYFHKYKTSYFEAMLSVRNEMISKHKIIMIYPYLFLLSHYIELVIKTVLFQNIEVDMSTHDLLKFFEENEDYLKKIGLQNNYYSYCVYQLNYIKHYTSNNDFSMCFRFPIDKKFNNLIISNKILNIEEKEINILIENHKTLLMILELIVQLSEKYFYDKLTNNLLQLEKNCREIIEKF